MLKETPQLTTISMCGIFAYLGRKPISVSEVLKILSILESEQEKGEKSPVGGDGAGIAFLNQKDRLHLVKVGKTRGSPVDDLTLQLGNSVAYSRLILGHVRHASPEFKATIGRKECTQPYKPTCSQSLRFASAHNGKVQNYLELKKQLSGKHSFESAKFELIDSEIIPHLLEELLSKTQDPRKATHTLFEQIEGTDVQGNTVVTIHADKDKLYLNAIQKGKTRGLIVWIDSDNEVLACSREKPVKTLLDRFLAENNYEKLITVTHRDSVNILAHFTIKPEQALVAKDERNNRRKHTTRVKINSTEGHF